MRAEPAGAQDLPQQGNKWLRRLLPLLILALGAGAMAILVTTRKKPKRQPRVVPGLLVKVEVARRAARTVEVVSHGQVQPRREVSIMPQVAGRVTWVNPRLVLGGLLRQREPLVRIDASDYKLALERARAALATAEQKLALEESSARVARQEWELLGSKVGAGKAAPSPLALREPQLRAARAALASAKADIKLAQLNLSRTTLRAPFNCRVRREAVEVGQIVSQAREVAALFGTDRAEVIVPVTASDLAWLELPRAGGGAGGAVTLRVKRGGVTRERAGRLVRTVGEIDSASRMSRVVVAVQDPYNLAGVADRPELEMGTFVEVLLTGRRLEGVFPIPVQALRIGSRVFLAGAKDLLEVRPVKALRLTATEALVSEGIKEGERVILSAIGGAVDGMKLRVQAARRAQPRAAKDAPAAAAEPARRPAPAKEAVR